LFNPNFKLFVLNHSSKIELNQEVITRYNIVNFSLKQESLEKQLLDLVYKTEQKDKFEAHAKRFRRIKDNKTELKD